jgi:peroxiredoxin
MKTDRLWVVAAMMAVAALGGGTLAAAEATVGEAAPDFSLSDAQQTAYTLSGQKGKYVVLEWFNPDCPFVRKHYDSGNMQGLQKTWTGKGVVWLSIDSSAPGKQGNYPADVLEQRMRGQGSAATAVLKDQDGKIGRLYGAKSTPHLFVINPEGILIYAGAIDSKASTDPADIPQATNYAQQALEESLTGKPVSTSSTKSYGCSVKYAD